MHPHHEDTLRNVTEKFARMDNVLALLLCGSIAHGFDTARSDVDIMIIVSDEEQAQRSKSGDVCYWDPDSATYEGGYVDGKYISLSYMRLVAERGSEPARFAFEGARIVFSKIDGLSEMLSSIARYPIAEKRHRMRLFYNHLKIWQWYAGEAISHDNAYLLQTSVNNLILFGGRLLLAYNEMLYPYHKWFLRALDGASNKPAGIMESIDALLRSPTQENIDRYCESILTYTDWGFAEYEFASVFLRYSEQNWIDAIPPVADF